MWPGACTHIEESGALSGLYRGSIGKKLGDVFDFVALFIVFLGFFMVHYWLKMVN